MHNRVFDIIYDVCFQMCKGARSKHRPEFWPKSIRKNSLKPSPHENRNCKYSRQFIKGMPQICIGNFDRHGGRDRESGLRVGKPKKIIKYI